MSSCTVVLSGHRAMVAKVPTRWGAVAGTRGSTPAVIGLQVFGYTVAVARAANAAWTHMLPTYGLQTLPTPRLWRFTVSDGGLWRCRPALRMPGDALA